MQGKRKDYQGGTETFINASWAQRFWMKLWKSLYAGVAIATYLAMIVSTGYAFYWAIINYNFLRAILAGLLTMLLVHVNSSNPR